MATNEPSVPSAPAPAQVCSHFIHMAQIAGSPNFQLGSQSCIEIWTCWRPSGHHLDTISTYLHYLSFREPGTIPLVLGPSLQRREIWRRSWKLCNLSCPVLSCPAEGRDFRNARRSELSLPRMDGPVEFPGPEENLLLTRANFTGSGTVASGNMTVFRACASDVFSYAFFKPSKICTIRCKTITCTVTLELQG